MQWLREPYLDYMMGRAVERPIAVELFGLLLGLDKEWREQGATEAEISLDAFGWDTVKTCGCGANCHAVGLPPRATIEETADFKIERDGLPFSYGWAPSGRRASRREPARRPS